LLEKEGVQQLLGKIILMLIFVFSFSFAQTKVDVTKFKQEIEKAGKNAQILDVRSTYEFGKGAIKVPQI